jgi:hypothetical protein
MWRDLERSTPVRNGVEIDIGNEEQWANDKYIVHKRVMDSGNPEIPDGIHLSIRRMDRAPARDWRDFQRIKNQLCGPEWEGVEIYPAESRLVDGANQYHLWCFPFKIGFGFATRQVSNQWQTSQVTPGAVQRDPETVDLRYGGLTPLKVLRGYQKVVQADGYGLPKEEK